MDCNYECGDTSERVSLDQSRGVDGCIDRLRHFGFAILAANCAPPIEHCRNIAAALELGEPYIPLLYRDLDIPANAPYVHIQRQAGSHPSFGGASEQALHVDGLLEQIGVVPTTMLHCVRPASSGGHTVILDAVGLWSDYLQQGGSTAMARDDVLLRRSSLPGVSRETLGPAFARADDGRWISRFSDGPTEIWKCEGPCGQEIMDTLAFFRENARQDGKRRITLKLNAGETLVAVNDRLAHGRTNFIDSPDAPRHLVRSIYSRGY